ncbi:MAG: efflux RND transporter permease subunit [Betaproteobacteria bacterium]|nr:efflux RND transporter permease subunit [Betaproteobacteria bacterium]
MLNALVRFSLQQRIILVVLAVALAAFGVRAMQNLSVDAFPDVTNVQVQIATEAPGRSPEEVERFITVPVEIAMTGLPGLVEMRSLNRNALSLITLVFRDDVDVYFARQLVMERIIEVRSRLPADISPVLGPVSTGLGEVYQYTLEKPDDKGRKLTEDELMERRTAQDWVVRPLLRSIQGVAEINSQGGFERQYQVLVNPDRMRHYELSLHEVYDALTRNNANSGGGILPTGDEQYLVRGIGLIRSIDDIRNIVLKEENGTPVFIRDVADVKIGAAVRVGALVKNGETEAVGGIVMMLRGGNAKEVVTRVKARVAEINAKGMLPGGLQIVPFYDRTELVDSALWTVVKVLLEGIALVIVVLFVFLGDLRSSLIVVASLCIAPLITFMAMNQFGISANLMSLGGLAIAIGLIVDGAVVVVENAFAQLSHRKGEGKLRIILEAVQQVATPVVYGVGIIILVFLPLMTLEGMEGKMFAPLAYTIAIALSASLLLALTLTPALCAYFLKGGHEEDTRPIRFLKRNYLRLLDAALRNERKTVIFAVIALLNSVSLFPLLGKSFIPTLKENSITPAISRMPNMSFEEVLNLEMEASKRIASVPGVRTVVNKVGRGESPADPQPHSDSDPVVSLVARDQWPAGTRSQEDFESAIREKLKDLPGISLIMHQPIAQRVDEMVTGVRSQVAIKIFGDDLDELKRVGDDIARVLNRVQGTQDLRIERLTGQQYLTVDLRRATMARYGLNASDVHDVIETAIGGKVATEIYEGERRFPAVVRFPEEFRNKVDVISDILLNSPSGAVVPLRAVADIKVVDGPVQTSREQGKRRIVVGTNVGGRDIGSYVKEAQDQIAAEVKLPEGYFLVWGGQFENMERAMSRLKIIVPITIAAIFFLLFTLFNSLRYAALIITVLPFASIGGVVALFVTGEYLSVPASVGFIALWGIAVLNGVVLVSYIRSLRQEGMTCVDAIVQGCTMRFRPVLMTATVAMLGLIPFLFATGPGSEVQRPLAIVVIGGLITSTLLTLVVVPTLYRWFEEKEVST